MTLRTLAVSAAGMAALLALAWPAHSLAGVVLHGVGTGSYTNVFGASCEAAFAVEIIYFPPDEALLHSEAPALCPDVGATLLLAAVSVNTTQMPPLVVDSFCVGNEADGLHCEVTNTANQTIEVDVGPSAGPGSMVTWDSRASGAYELHGQFLAV